MNSMKKSGAILAGCLFLAGAVAGPANAAPKLVQGDGLIQVQITDVIGDVTITDAVDIGVAAQIAANVCDVKVGPLAVLGTAVDTSDKDDTVCTSDEGDVVVFTNN